MRPVEAFLVVALVLLLAATAIQYEQTSSLQNQINNLQNRVNAIPDNSAQIYQIEQQLSNLQSHTNTTTIGSAFMITALCVNVSQRCVNSTGNFVFFLAVRNTGTSTIPAGYDNTVSFKGVNGTKPFAGGFNITISALPPGSSTSVGLTSWQSVFGAGNQPPFAKGNAIGLYICLWQSTCQETTTAAGG
jgi:hypothetical protein